MMTLFLPVVILKLNPANKILNVSFLQVHASASVTLKETSWTTSLKLYLDAVRGVVRTLHNTCTCKNMTHFTYSHAYYLL